jgi:hypothetical protein
MHSLDVAAAGRARLGHNRPQRKACCAAQHSWHAAGAQQLRWWSVPAALLRSPALQLPASPPPSPPPPTLSYWPSHLMADSRLLQNQEERLPNWQGGSREVGWSGERVVGWSGSGWPAGRAAAGGAAAGLLLGCCLSSGSSLPHACIPQLGVAQEALGGVALVLAAATAAHARQHVVCPSVSLEPGPEAAVRDAGPGSVHGAATRRIGPSDHGVGQAACPCLHSLGAAEHAGLGPAEGIRPAMARARPGCSPAGWGRARESNAPNAGPLTLERRAQHAAVHHRRRCATAAAGGRTGCSRLQLPACQAHSAISGTKPARPGSPPRPAAAWCAPCRPRRRPLLPGARSGEACSSGSLAGSRAGGARVHWRARGSGRGSGRRVGGRAGGTAQVPQEFEIVKCAGRQAGRPSTRTSRMIAAS